MRHTTLVGRPGQLELSILPDAEGGFPFGLHLSVRVEQLESSEAVIACYGCACLPNHAAKLAPDDYSEWFAGPLDNTRLNESFEQFFFSAIDWCIQTSPGVVDTFTGVFKWTVGGTNG